MPYIISYSLNMWFFFSHFKLHNEKINSLLEKLLDFGLKYPQDSLFVVWSQKKILSMKVQMYEYV